MKQLYYSVSEDGQYLTDCPYGEGYRIHNKVMEPYAVGSIRCEKCKYYRSGSIDDFHYREDYVWCNKDEFGGKLKMNNKGQGSWETGCAFIMSIAFLLIIIWASYSISESIRQSRVASGENTRQYIVTVSNGGKLPDTYYLDDTKDVSLPTFTINGVTYINPVVTIRVNKYKEK